MTAGSARGLLVLPLLILSGLRGLVTPRKPLGMKAALSSYVDIVAASFLDGMATVGGVFASLDQGRPWLVWLCVGSAALAGFYTLPVQYADRCKCLAKSRFRQLALQYSRIAVIVLSLSGCIVGIVLLSTQKKPEAPHAYGWAILTLGPVLYLWQLPDPKVKVDAPRASFNPVVVGNPAFEFKDHKFALNL